VVRYQYPSISSSPRAQPLAGRRERNGVTNQRVVFGRHPAGRPARRPRGSGRGSHERQGNKRVCLVLPGKRSCRTAAPRQDCSGAARQVEAADQPFEQAGFLRLRRSPYRAEPSPRANRACGGHPPDRLEPRMPDVDQRRNVEAILARARSTAADENGRSGIAILRPDRSALLMPRLPQSAELDALAKNMERVIPSAVKRNIAVIADTSFAETGQKRRPEPGPCEPDRPVLWDAGRPVVHRPLRLDI